jgi:hypothetical protein
MRAKGFVKAVKVLFVLHQADATEIVKFVSAAKGHVLGEALIKIQQFPGGYGNAYIAKRLKKIDEHGD